LSVGRLVAGDAVAPISDQFLDQLGPRGLVLDQHLGRVELVLLLAHGQQGGKGRNPATGEEIQIKASKASKKVAFRVAKGLRKAI
jgi:hypothetical protein